MENAKASETKIEEIKRYTFTKIIKSQEVTSEGPKNVEQKPEKEKESTKLDFILILYEDGIVFDIKEIKEDRKTPVAAYETMMNLETLKDICSLFAKLNTEKIYELIQKSFELNYENISIEEKEIKIKLMINIMNVVTEEINFDIPKLKFTKEEEFETLKESIKILENEKNSLKKEVKALNILFDELKKKIEEKNNEQQNKGKELQSKMEEEKNSLKNIIEEKDSQQQNKVKELQLKVEKQENELHSKIEEKNSTLKNMIQQEKNSLKSMMEQENNSLKSMIDKIMKEMEGLKKVEKYAKEKIIVEESDEKEKKNIPSKGPFNTKAKNSKKK